MKKILFILSLFTAISILVLPACQGGGTTTVLTTSTVTVPLANAISFSADLSGVNEIPQVTTNMTGHFDISFDTRLTKAVFRLTLNNASGFISSQLHLGDNVTSGPAIASIYGSATGETAPTIIINGTLTDADMMGDVSTIVDLESAIAAGGVYVDAHTSSTPSGAIRGQLEASNQPLPVGGDVVTIIATQDGFNPPEITVSSGTTVVWYNPGPSSVEIGTASDKFGAVILPGMIYEYTFTELATYVYYLVGATSITGSINVA
jgi:plastocyanin